MPLVPPSPPRLSAPVARSAFFSYSDSGRPTRIYIPEFPGRFDEGFVSFSAPPAAPTPHISCIMTSQGLGAAGGGSDKKALLASEAAGLKKETLALPSAPHFMEKDGTVKACHPLPETRILASAPCPQLSSPFLPSSVGCSWMSLPVAASPAALLLCCTCPFSCPPVVSYLSLAFTTPPSSGYLHPLPLPSPSRHTCC